MLFSEFKGELSMHNKKNRIFSAFTWIITLGIIFLNINIELSCFEEDKYELSIDFLYELNIDFSYIEAFDCGQIDSDDALEIVLGTYSNQNDFIVIYEFSNGVYSEEYLYEGVDKVVDIRIGDSDGDGRNEILVAMWNQVLILGCNDNDLILEDIVLAGTRYGTALEMYDFDGNNGEEIIIGVSNQNPNIRIYSYNDGDYTETWNHSFPVQDDQVVKNSSVAIGDINGDQQMDLVTSEEIYRSSLWPDPYITYINCYIRDGNNFTYQPLFQRTQQSHIHEIFVEDVNYDGENEILFIPYSPY